jgi:hypothetical protein
MQDARNILCALSRPAQLTHLVLKWMTGYSLAEELSEQIGSLIGMRRLQASVYIIQLPVACSAHLGPQLRRLPQLQWLDLEHNSTGARERGSACSCLADAQWLNIFEAGR